MTRPESRPLMFRAVPATKLGEHSVRLTLTRRLEANNHGRTASAANSVGTATAGCKSTGSPKCDGHVVIWDAVARQTGRAAHHELDLRVRLRTLRQRALGRVQRNRCRSCG